MTKRFLALGLAALATAGCNSGTSPADTQSQTSAGSEAASAPMPDQAAASPPVFVQCRTCHQVEPGRNGAGPTLHGVFGATAGKVEGFPYSPALKGSSIVWDRTTLDQWLAAPIKMVPGTRMVTMVPDPAQRAQIIDYLETLK